MVDATEASVVEATETPTEASVVTTAQPHAPTTAPVETATSAPVKYEVMLGAQAGLHGVITVDGTAMDSVTFAAQVESGKPFTFQIVPGEGFDLDTVKANGTALRQTANKNEYKLGQVTQNVVLYVTYKELPKVTATPNYHAEAGRNGKKPYRNAFVGSRGGSGYAAVER